MGAEVRRGHGTFHQFVSSEGWVVKLIIYFKSGAELDRIANYIGALPKASEYKDILEKLELPEES